MSQVAPVRTPVADQDLLDGLRDAWALELRSIPTVYSLAVLAAQVRLETAHGQQCWNYNLGNYKAYKGVDCMPLHTTERLPNPDGTFRVITLVCLFAAYPSLRQGCEAFIRNIYMHWPAAWHEVIVGDPVGYAKALYDQKPPYYTADPEQYASAVHGWFGYYLAKLGGDAAPTEPELPPIAFALPDIANDTDDPPDAA